MKFISKLCFLLGTSILLSLFSHPLHAYPVSPFNAQGLLNAASVVCYGKVVAIGKRRVEPDASFYPPITTEGAVATVKIISLIKGKSPATIKVVFRRPAQAQMVDYTQLVQNESAILFLKPQNGFYRLVDDHNGKLQVPLHQPVAYKSVSPSQRMAAELILASQLDKGLIRLVCIEQLGSFALPEVITHLARLTSAPDIAVQGTALATLIRLDHPPRITQLAAFFRRRDDTQSFKRFGTTLYNMGHLKAQILMYMEDRFNVIGRDFDSEFTAQAYVVQKKAARAAAQQWKTFDLIRFLKVAIDNTPPEKNDAGENFVSYRSIADMLANQIDPKGRPAYLNHTFRERSRPLVVRLLESANPETSEAAARAIDRMIVEKHKFPYPQGSRQESARYVKTVREWITKNPRWAKSDG